MASETRTSYWGKFFGLGAMLALLLTVSCGKDESGEANEDDTGKSGKSSQRHPGGGAGEGLDDPATKSGRKPAAPPTANLMTTESGLQYEVLQEGDGPKPGPTDKVTVHYHGTLEDGTVFDSSVERNQPATFPVNGVIQGWIEGLQLMKVGSKYRFVIPPELAYGKRGAGGKIGPDATLIFEVELIGIE